MHLDLYLYLTFNYALIEAQKAADAASICLEISIFLGRYGLPEYTKSIVAKDLLAFRLHVGLNYVLAEAQNAADTASICLEISISLVKCALSEYTKPLVAEDWIAFRLHHKPKKRQTRPLYA